MILIIRITNIPTMNDILTGINEVLVGRERDVQIAQRVLVRGDVAPELQRHVVGPRGVRPRDLRGRGRVRYAGSVARESSCKVPGEG